MDGSFPRSFTQIPPYGTLPALHERPILSKERGVLSQRRAEHSHSDSYRQLVTAVIPGSWASSRVSRRKCCVESNSSTLAGSRLLCASENGGEVSAAASGVADRIHPVRSSVLRCRGLPHRGAALCGYTPGCRSGFIKVPHCCPSSLRCMWTHIIGRTVSAAFKRGDMGGKNTQEESRKLEYIGYCPNIPSKPCVLSCM